uniref:F-box only protein 43-like isoform X2 n=1 Tax=Myxine glutinosa TaxID=7769 RepID=UPI00358E6B89
MVKRKSFSTYCPLSNFQPLSPPTMEKYHGESLPTLNVQLQGGMSGGMMKNMASPKPHDSFATCAKESPLRSKDDSAFESTNDDCKSIPSLSHSDVSVNQSGEAKRSFWTIPLEDPVYLRPLPNANLTHETSCCSKTATDSLEQGQWRRSLIFNESSYSDGDMELVFAPEMTSSGKRTGGSWDKTLEARRRLYAQGRTSTLEDLLGKKGNELEHFDDPDAVFHNSGCDSGIGTLQKSSIVVDDKEDSGVTSSNEVRHEETPSRINQWLREGPETPTVKWSAFTTPTSTTSSSVMAHDIQLDLGIVVGSCSPWDKATENVRDSPSCVFESLTSDGSFSESDSGCEAEVLVQTQDLAQRCISNIRRHRLSTISERSSQSEEEDNAKCRHKTSLVHWRAPSISDTLAEEVSENSMQDELPTSVPHSKCTAHNAVVETDSWSTPQRSVAHHTPIMEGERANLVPGLCLAQALAERFHKELSKEGVKTSSASSEKHTRMAMRRAQECIMSDMSGSPALQFLIGKKMGLIHFDVLSELHRRDLWHIVNCIIESMDLPDVLSAMDVSKIWRKIFMPFLQSKQWELLESKVLKENKSQESWGYADRRLALSSLQHVGTAGRSPYPLRPYNHALSSPRTSAKGGDKALPRDRAARFHQAASELRVDEELRMCPRCQFPARYDRIQERAVCVSLSCTYDFCERCMCAYHGSRPCSTSSLGAGSTPGLRSRRGNEGVPGTKQSKQRLRRL